MLGNKTANPAPLGLLGFGMTTVLLNLHNAGFIELSVVIAAMGFTVGGLAQVIAGIFEFKNGNTFGGTAFVGYGFFWISLVFIWMNPLDVMEDADDFSLGFYLALWGAFTLFMFIGTLKHNRITQIVFLTLTILFFGLAAGHFLDYELIIMLSGLVGIVCGGSAIYASVGNMLKEEYGRELLPLGTKKPLA